MYRLLPLLPVLLTSCASSRVGSLIDPFTAEERPDGTVLIAEGLTLPSGSVEMDCGPEAICAVASFWNRELDVEEAIRSLYLPDRKGTFSHDLVRYAQEKGFSVTLRSGTIGALKNSIDAKAPPIILVELRADIHHYFVVVGYNDALEMLYCLDYDHRLRQIDYLELDERWRPTRREMILIEPGTLASEFELAAADEQHGRYEEAVERFEKILQQEPRHVEALAGLGNSLRKLDRTAEAREAYERALKVTSTNATVLNNLADLLLETGADAGLIEPLCEKAVDLLKAEVSRLTEALNTEAAPHARKALSTEIQRAEIRFAFALGTLGEARSRAGKPELAAAAWKASLDRLPNTYPDARARRMFDLYRANTALGMGSIAREWLTKALAEAHDSKLRATIEKELR